jgi:transcription initiation factor IIE alpha subunit
LTVINEDELTRAIERTLVSKGKVPGDDARRVARTVLNYFGLDDTVLDNKLSSEDRDHFYRLEEEGLLTSEEEDATVSRGKTWRIHYWLLKKDRIRDVGQSRPSTEEPGAEAVYTQMSDSAWAREGEARRKAPPA